LYGEQIALVKAACDSCTNMLWKVKPPVIVGWPKATPQHANATTAAVEIIKNRFIVFSLLGLKQA